jgi:hypothetical protein
MALSASDLTSAYKTGARFATVDASGKATEVHQDYGAAVKAGGHPNSSVSSISSAGALTGIPNSDPHRHNYGKAR